MEKRFIFGSLEKWNGEYLNGVYSNRGTNEENYWNSIVFITEAGNDKKGTMIYTHGAYFEMSNQSDVIDIIRGHLKEGKKINFTGTPETGLTINVDYVTTVEGTCVREEDGYYNYSDNGVDGYQLVEARAVAGALTEPFKLSLAVDGKKGQFTQHFKTLNGDDVTFASAIIEAGDGLAIEQTTEGLKLSADLTNLKGELDYKGDEVKIHVDEATRTISHAAAGMATTTSGQNVTAEIPTFTVEEYTFDVTGHVNSQNIKTVTLPSTAFSDTTYSAGTGLTLNGTTFNHTNSVEGVSLQQAEMAEQTPTADAPSFTFKTYGYDDQGHVLGSKDAKVNLPATAFVDTKLTSATINAGEITAVDGTVSVVSNTATSLTGTDGQSITGSFTAVNVPTKTYVDNLVANKNVTASGDTYVSATVAEGTNHVTVAASEKLTNAVTLAEGSVQDVTTGTTYGTILVDNVEVAVAGLEDLAYAEVEDKIISLNDGKLSSTLTFTKETIDGTEYLIIKGIEGQEIGKVPTSDFVKDGMLSNVSFSEETNDLTFTFNTDAGKEDVVVPLDSLVNIYTGSNGVKVEGYSITGVVDPKSESFLTVGTDGFKLSGVQEAINTAVSNKNVSAEGDTYVTASASGNKVTVAASESTKTSLGKADTALQEVTKGTDGEFVTTTIGAKTDNKQSVAVSVKTVDITGATEENDGLAVASDVKSYVDGKVGAIKHSTVAASTDTESAKYLTVEPTADNSTNKDYIVKVSGIDTAISTAVSNAEGQIQLTSTRGVYEFAAVENKDGYVKASQLAEVLNEAWAWGTL